MHNPAIAMIPTSAPTSQHVVADTNKVTTVQSLQYKDLNENNSLAYNANTKIVNSRTDQRASINKGIVSSSQHDKQPCEFSIYCFIYVVLCQCWLINVRGIIQYGMFIEFYECRSSKGYLTFVLAVALFWC